MASHSDKGRLWGLGLGPAPTGPTALWRQLRLIASVRAKMALREFWHEVRTTPQGKFAVVVLLTVPLFGRSMVQSAHRIPEETSVDGSFGIVLVGMVLTIVGCALGSMSNGVQSLVLTRRMEALRAFPALKGPIATYHMAFETVGWICLFLVGWFTLMYAPTAYALHSNHLMSLLIVLGTVSTLCVAAGVAAYGHMLRWVEVRPESSRALHLVFALISIAIFAFLPIAPRAIYNRWPERVEALGSTFHLAGPEIAVQLTVTALVILLTVWRTRAKLIETARVPSPVIWNGAAVQGRNRFESTFTHLVRPGHTTNRWRIFLAKDVFLPWSRRPSSMVFEFLLTIALAATGASLAIVAHERIPQQAELWSELSLVGFSLAAIAWVSVYRGVGCVGVETPLLRILSSAVGVSKLWSYKVLSSFAALIPHLVIVGGSMVVGTMIWGTPSRLGYELMILLGGAISFPLIGVGVGFLFPKLDSVKSGLVPGATMVGKALAAAMMLYFTGTSVALLWITRAAIAPTSVVPLAVILSTVGLSGLALLMTMLGIRRLKGLEL